MMEIRAYRGEDEAGVLGVWGQTMTHDRLTPDVFRCKVLLDANFLPAQLPVAVVDGQVVGFALGLTRQVPLFLQGLEPEKSWITAFGVLPEYRRRGIGRALFEYLLTRWEGEGRQTVEISPYTPNYFTPGVDKDAYPEAVQFLQAGLGFEVDTEAVSMGLNLSGFQIPAEVSELERKRATEDGLEVRAVEAADLPDLMPFIARYFGWDWFRHLQEYLLEYFGDSPNQITFLVARLKGEIVGFCPQRRERFGPFGVHPEVRNLGIGRILLFRCLEAVSSRQTYFSYFMWTEENAARLYTMAGYRTRRQYVLLRKNLQSATQAEGAV